MKKITKCITAMLPIIFLLLGCSNPYERDNPMDPAIVHKITFNANGATGTPPAALSGGYGDIVTLPDGSGLVKNGYVFNYWEYGEGRGNAGASYTIEGSVTMNANWLQTYTVAFDGNGATSGTAPPAMTVGSGKSVQIPGNGLQKTGYVFDGWTENSSGTGTKYSSSYYVTGNVTLYAKWLPASTATFNGNGAASGTAPVAMTVASGSNVQLPARGNLERSGYLFAGWNTDISGSGITHKAGSSYTVAEDITLYAVWVNCNNSETHLCDMRDEKVYRITAICGLLWTAENLNYNASGSKCYGEGSQVYAGYNNLITLSSSEVQANCEKYGRLYNWSTAINACPTGWHLPSMAEWNVLGNDTRKLKATSGWNNNSNGTDDYGFSALPGGTGNYLSMNGNPFGGAGQSGEWWTANDADDHNYSAYYRSIFYGEDYASWHHTGKSGPKSVRCVKDGGVPASSGPAVYGTPVDYDGKIYQTVVIGTQTWMAENLNYKTSSGSRCYGNLDSNCDAYGRVYNWATAMTICPVGWHLPTQAEWNMLGDDAKKLKATTGWDNNGNGTDDYGFSALPGGALSNDAGSRSEWWTADEVNSGGSNAYTREMQSGYGSDAVYWDQNIKSNMVYVRCVKD